MTVLVTGGAGFVGSYVVGALDEEGIPVILVDKNGYNNQNKNTIAIKVDANDLDALSKLMFDHSVSTVIHLIGFPHVGDCERDPMTSFRLNTLSTQNVVEAMRKANAKKIVFSSSASVYGYQTKEKVSEEDLPRPDTIYGFHKLLSEQIIKSYKERYGMDFLILRLFNIYGGDPTCKKDVISLFIKRLLDKKPLILMDPNKFRDFVHVEDVAQAFQKACNTNISNEVLNVGSGIKITLRQLVDIFTSVSTNIKVIEKKTSEDGTGLYADVTLAKKLLAFNPKDPNEGLGNYIKQYYDKLSK